MRPQTLTQETFLFRSTSTSYYCLNGTDKAWSIRIASNKAKALLKLLNHRKVDAVDQWGGYWPLLPERFGAGRQSSSPVGAGMAGGGDSLRRGLYHKVAKSLYFPEERLLDEICGCPGAAPKTVETVASPGAARATPSERL